MERYKLTVAANMLGITPWTLRLWIRQGKVPGIHCASGRLYLPGGWVAELVGSVRCAIYARESSSENQAALESQTQGLAQSAQAKGYPVVRGVREFGSGVSDERNKLHALLDKRAFAVLWVEHQDRLTRFGFHGFERLAPFKIEVVNTAENHVNDLMEDLVAILTSCSARWYGQRRGRQQTQAAMKALQEWE